MKTKYKLQIIYVYSVCNRSVEDRDFISFISDKIYNNYKEAIAMAKTIMEYNEEIFVNIIEVLE